jgi:hypothetical protein
VFARLVHFARLHAVVVCASQTLQGCAKRAKRAKHTTFLNLKTKEK